ncbi:class I SAM-dependent methyltransferase [Streptomyces sp. bgisy100]|uniref:class I SAM-dependent methyltransferase n=1 Tax=Streptomyces sp. bgisy100 TaxID=3413783 RepID=UPI003D735C42
MPFDHNDHYHRLLLRHVPAGCRTALDVGCGTGRFARRLAALGIDVDAIDASEETIEAARREAYPEARRGTYREARRESRQGVGTEPRFRHADLTEAELPHASYDFISCLACLHHMPFDTVSRLRDALKPGGVLVILGCYPERTATDWAWSLAAAPVNAASRLAVAMSERLSSRAPDVSEVRAPVKPPAVSFDEIRQRSAELLPGRTLRRLLFWRCLLVFRNEAAD